MESPFSCESAWRNEGPSIIALSSTIPTQPLQVFAGCTQAIVFRIPVVTTSKPKPLGVGRSYYATAPCRLLEAACLLQLADFPTAGLDQRGECRVAIDARIGGPNFN